MRRWRSSKPPIVPVRVRQNLWICEDAYASRRSAKVRHVATHKSGFRLTEFIFTAQASVSRSSYYEAVPWRLRLNPNPFLGVLYHWTGGLSAASCYIPFRGIRRWSWEIYWLVQGCFSWIFAPLL